MRALFLVLAMAVMALAGGRADAATCQYQATTPAGFGMSYLATSMTVSRNSQCQHSVSGTIGGVRIVTPPRNGRVDSTSGGLIYVPNPGFVGSDSYVFGASYPGGRAEVTVSVSVVE